MFPGIRKPTGVPVFPTPVGVFPEGGFIMANIRELAIAFADKQAALRSMTPAEYLALIEETEAGFKASEESAPIPAEDVHLVVDPKTAIRKNGVICCVCGKTFRVLSARHLKTHELTPDRYRELCGYPRGTSLACGTLRKQREEKMRSMQLWTRRRKNVPTEGAA